MTRRLANQDGMLLVELLVATFVLVVGILGLFGALDSARKLSLNSERETAMAQVARAEVERVLSLSYSAIALNATPAHAATGPDSYLSPSSTPTTFQYDPSNTSATEALDVDTTNGTLSSTGTAWSDGNNSGVMYDFVTWHTDGDCGSGCPTSDNYKRITVEVTVTTPTGVRGLKPVVYSTLIPDPNNGPNGEVSNGTENPLESPSTTCQNSSSQQVSCSQGIDNGNTNLWYLHNTTVGGSDPVPSARATLPTTSATGTCTSSNTTLCATPPGMDTKAPACGTGGCSSTACANYSTDADPGGANALPTADGWTSSSCGRVLEPPSSGASCTQAAANEVNLASQLWVTTALSSSITLTGYGGIEFWTQALGSSSSVGFCLAIYDIPAADMPSSSTALETAVPTPIGTVEYSPTSWPTATTDQSFTFEFDTGSVTIPSGDRIGVRVWLTSASPVISLLYDNPTEPAELQLNSSE